MYENYYKKHKTFSTIGFNETYTGKEEKQKIHLKNFDAWINQYGSIKQIYTTASLLQIMVHTSVFFLANEGDAILQESSFYSPADVTADMKQGTLIDCKLDKFLFLSYRHLFSLSISSFLTGWDGNRIIKSTIARGSEVVKDRTVNICIASTGRRWPDLLKDLAYASNFFFVTVIQNNVFPCVFRKVQMAGGLHERCNYFCFDVNDQSNRTQLTPLAEKQFYSGLYDELLSLNATNNRLSYSLSQLYFVIKLFGHRIFIWSREAFSMIQPRLQELKGNKPCKLLSDTTTFNTKQQMALRRRSAEHVVRYACLIQTLMNATQVLQAMENNTGNFKGGAITEEFEIEAREKVNIFWNERMLIYSFFVSRF